jgi:dienelactone hydrolase
MMKKTLAVILACVMALSLLSTAALAKGEEAPSGDAMAATSFEDVAPGAWYYEAVQYAAQTGIMAGVNDRNFAPDALMTRAMLATLLYRLDGSKKTEKAAGFSDVPASAWFYDAVQWAAANGIAQGDDRGGFGAGEPVTRQQVAVMFHGYAKYKGRATALVTADLSAYADASEISEGARGAMKWAMSVGLFTGTGSSMLAPGQPASRAQAAAVLLRYVNGVSLEARTSDYVSQFVKGNFSEFYADAGDELRQSITLDKLVAGWNTILQMTGAPGESLGSVYVRQNGMDVVISSVTGTLYNIKITVTYDGDGKPAGIWVNYVPKDSPTPQSSEKWEEIPVTVGDKDLAGMLTLPKGVQKPPVVILIQGSGSTDMNEAIGTAPNRPFEDLARGLAGQGVATLRYNKRTYQYPAGGNATIQYEMLDDAAAAVKLLMSDSRVDANRIYLLGHSLGGMMAPKITADNLQIKGFISLAGSLRPLRDIILDQDKAVIAVTPSLTEQQKSDALAQVKAELDKTITLDDGGTGSILGWPTTYWKSLNDIDGLAIVKNLNVPMLILQGSADFQVYSDVDYKLWQSTLSGRGNVTFKLYDGLSHLFMPNQIPADGAPDVSVYNAPNHIDPAVIKDISAWINSL